MRYELRLVSAGVETSRCRDAFRRTPRGGISMTTQDISMATQDFPRKTFVSEFPLHTRRALSPGNEADCDELVQRAIGQDPMTFGGRVKRIELEPRVGQHRGQRLVDERNLGSLRDIAVQARR